MNNKYWLETYGCQMNVAESASIENSMKLMGWESASKSEDANLVLLNTCSVRKTAESRVWGRLGFYKAQKKNSEFQLAIMGCMTERLKDFIRKEVPEVDLLIGTYGKKEFISALESNDYFGKQDFFGHDEFSFASNHFGEGMSQAMVPIMHGCDNFCTYCIVPHVRGREVSRTPNEILDELQRLSNEKVQEVTLLGQNVNSYNYKDNGNTILFSDLLNRIQDKVDIPWIRFISSHPKDLSDELIESMKANPQLCRHIHLPVQHGSNNILKRMNRRYTKEDFLSLVDRIRTAMPDISLTTDILMGFPGETEEDVEETLDLIEKVRFIDAFTYQFNAMEGTEAFDMVDKIEEGVKKARLARVIERQRAIGYEEKNKFVNTNVEVLVEGLSKKDDKELLGRTFRNNMVVFPGSGDLIGKIITIHLNELAGNTFRGEIVK